MNRGPKPLAQTIRRRNELGADCLNCTWQNSECNRQRAMQHARRFGHAVQFLVEETTVYIGLKVETP